MQRVQPNVILLYRRTCQYVGMQSRDGLFRYLYLLLPHLFAYFSQSEDRQGCPNDLSYFCNFLHALVSGRGFRVSQWTSSASVVQSTCLVDELWIHSRSWLTETRPSDEPFVHWVMVLKKSRMTHCDAVWIFCKVFENSSLPFWSHGLLGRLDFESVFALLKDFRPSLECCMEATEKCCIFSLFKPREDCDWSRLRHLITFIWSKILSLKTVLV